MRADIIHINQVMGAIPGLNRKTFKQSRLYLQWLKMHEIRFSRQTIYFPREKVVTAFKMEKIPLP